MHSNSAVLRKKKGTIMNTYMKLINEGSMIMEITVRITSNYGAKTVYPVCETAKIFADIAGTKTLKPTTINSIKALGYKIVVQQEEI
jgi:hypothetical protein